MYKLLTIFNIVAGAASIMALLLQQFAPPGTWPHRVVLPIAVVAGGLCLYVLFVPSSWLERNVRRKVERYSATPDTDNPTLIIQQGTLRFVGFGRRTVRFHEPFASPPEVELLDTYGKFDREGGLPRIVSTTANAFVVRRGGGIVFAAPKCDWVARGTPLDRPAA